MVIENENGERITPDDAHGIVKKYVWDEFLRQAKKVEGLTNDDFFIELDDELYNLEGYDGVTLADLIKIAGLSKPQ